VGWIWVFGEVLAGKGNGGGVSALLWLRGTEGEERREVGSGVGGATRRKEEGGSAQSRHAEESMGPGGVRR
jgi:hypothetical protein